MAKSLLGALISVRNDSPVPYVSRRTGLSIATPSRVNREQEMAAYSSVGTLFAIVNRTANATSLVDWKLWRKAASGLDEDRTEVTRHPALTVWNRPNPFMTRQELVETGQQHRDLTGETWLTVAFSAGRPIELWPVRPDRMEPVPHPTKFIERYEYRAPDGTRVPLETDEVIFMRMPNPLDIYRGLGPVQALLMDLDSTRYSAEWNRNFFINGAEPGGIIEVEDRLSDSQYDEFRDRWADNHQGVANAHRVALLENGGKWVERKYTQKDMQFVELRQVSREVIREGFGFPKPLLGSVDDVNRANADAAEVVFARWLMRPRLECWKQALNNDFLKLFPGSEELEFDYENPVPDDREADNAERTSKANAAKVYIDLGFEPAEVLDHLGLPEMTYEKPEPVVPQLPPGADPDDDQFGNLLRVPAIVGRALPAPVSPGAPALARWWAADVAPELPDVGGLQDDYEIILADLLRQWEGIGAAQRAELVAQARRIAASGSVADLSRLHADSGDAAAALGLSMATAAQLAGQRVQAEAAAQGVEDVPAGLVPPATLAAVATVTAAGLAAELAVSAARAAMLANGAGAPAEAIAEAVREHLESLSDAWARRQLGGALTGAQNAGRIATLKVAPEGAIYSSEMNDSNTCKPCKAVNGTFLGNISEMEQVEKSYPGGAYGGYIACQGGVNCRGTIVGVWRPKRVGESG
jgi:HK97 family phage portal protein